MALLDAGRLAGLVGDIFTRAGCPQDEAKRIGTSLTAANLTGHDSHGVQRVPRYVGWLREGAVKAGQSIRVLIDTPALAVVDGQYGFGQTVGPQSVEVGIGKAKASGVAMVALRNAGHLGRIGEYGEIAAAQGLVSIHFVNVVGSILVAPYGGVDRRLSTAPFTIGVPMAEGPPLLLDFATSLVAEGKVLVASLGGKELPKDALITPEGQISDDPHVLYGPYAESGPRNADGGLGAIRAFGDHKGSGLAFMCEILGGALTGAGATGPGKRFANGMMSIYIDPKVVDPEGLFPAECAEYVRYFKSARPAKAGEPVLVPGEPERLALRMRESDGLTLSEATWASIRDTAVSVGISDKDARKAEKA